MREVPGKSLGNFGEVRGNSGKSMEFSGDLGKDPPPCMGIYGVP